MYVVMLQKAYKSVDVVVDAVTTRIVPVYKCIDCVVVQLLFLDIFSLLPFFL